MEKMKIALHSAYDSFTLGRVPQYIEWSRSGKIHAYVNEAVRVPITDKEKSIAILIEPRSIQEENYTYIESNFDKYAYVFTHDTQLLTFLPNAKKLFFGGVWDARPEEKTKYISMVAGRKDICLQHRLRTALAYELENKIDVYGDYNGGPKVDTITSHGPYKYAVVIENYIDDYWFTEKLCNCLASKTIPLYVGARKIDEVFNTRGIYQFKNIADLRRFVCLMVDNKELYENEYKRLNIAIEDNFRRVQDYLCFEDWFYRKYKDLLEGI